MLKSSTIKDLAHRAGFDLCGITSCRHFAENEHHFREWLAAGYGADLLYLERNLDKRFDVAKLVEGVKTIIVCAVNYKSARSLGYPTPNHRTKIASYACNRDYHSVIKEMLTTLYASLKEIVPSLKARAFTDSAPLLEKQLAVEAGLGWIGRQSLLVTPSFGTFVLLGELVIDQEVDSYDSPFVGSRCGECHRCIEACPNSAILPTMEIDARCCISRLTIEKEMTGEPNSTSLDGWIFGCDACQSCCPHNRTTPCATNPNFATPLFDPASLSAEEWLTMTKEQFSERFGNTPLIRSGLPRIQKNINQD
ncbi:MAG: tRNA epoxyqueuosine(34) reductase QueG [Alistipes sp.]|nr:tRNA epoxyqueuosine(34) reductase QueG [Alistipes sp.]